MKGTATTAIAGINVFIDKSGFQGKVEFPPIIANDSIRKVGARVVKKVDWTALDDFLKEKLTSFLKHETNDPPQEFFSFFSPSCLIFSTISGVSILKYR